MYSYCLSKYKKILNLLSTLNSRSKARKEITPNTNTTCANFEVVVLVSSGHSIGGHVDVKMERA